MDDKLYAGIDLDQLIRGKIGLVGFEESEKYSKMALLWLNKVISSYVFLDKLKENFEVIGTQWGADHRFGFLSELYKNHFVGKPKSLRDCVEQLRRHDPVTAYCPSDVEMEDFIDGFRKSLPRGYRGYIFVLNEAACFKKVQRMKTIEVHQIDPYAMNMTRWIDVVADRFSNYSYHELVAGAPDETCAAIMSHFMGEDKRPEEIPRAAID